MVAYFSSRKRLWTLVGLLVGALLTIRAIADAVYVYIPQYGFRNDFRLLYGDALVGLRVGYSHLYDFNAQRTAVEGLGLYWSPFLNPPPLVWAATPFTLLPFTAAIVLWTVLIVAAAVLAWYLAAPGSGLTKAAFGLLWIGVVPVSFGLGVGQSVALVAAAVAACWWFAERDRPAAAGLALSLIVFKPQLAILVPLCLVVAGHGRIFGAWLAATAVMVLVSLAMLGANGLGGYRDALALASQWQITRSYAVSGLIGTGVQLYVAQAIVLAATLAAAWRRRGGGTAIPIAAGIAGSLLFTPYVGFQDFAMLVVAGWLVLRERPSPWQVGLMVVGFSLLQLVLVVLAVPIIAGEILFLGLLLAPAAQSPRDLPGVHGVVRDQVAH
ncbi:MAG TPA: glycosyltransferase family 87 protein [Candidatus Dormibacteraeota bacterium]